MGESVLYCDVGRGYPWKLLDHEIGPLFHDWTESSESIMPGVEIPWHGAMGQWTKREALRDFAMDNAETRLGAPIQASFSFWKKSDQALKILDEWLRACCQRSLVSDDPSELPQGLAEHPEFEEHRHDQSLLTLIARKNRLKPISLNSEKMPLFDEKNPSRVSKELFQAQATPLTSLEKVLIRGCESLEKRLRG